MMDKETVRNK